VSLCSKNDIAKLWLHNQFFIRARIENKVTEENGERRDQLPKNPRLKLNPYLNRKALIFIEKLRIKYIP